MALPTLIVGDVQGDHERLAEALTAYPDDEVETIFLGDFFTGGRPGDAGGHRAARIALGRRNSRAILGNHDLLVMALVEERRHGGERLRARDGELLETIWRRRRGDPADLAALAADGEMEEWLRGLPVMLLLDDATLVQHTDDDAYAALGDSVAAVNRAAALMLTQGPAGLLGLLRHLIGRRAFDDAPRLDAYLRRFGARRLVHGHTPHWGSGPDIRHSGRLIGYDGRFSRFWGRDPGEEPGPVGATIALLPG
ncbi:MAG TPA: metallophosphoesterase family protein [Candidatus Binatia bacterium]|nr:metallophosphoesterase family protein [Candidatus Binatia bacterium]